MATSGSLVWGEAEIVRLLLEGRNHDAVQAVLAWMGPEVRALLLAGLEDRAAADEAFARFQRDVYVRLDRWSRTGSLRLWALGLARDAAHRTPPHRRFPYPTTPCQTAPPLPADPAPPPGLEMDDLAGLRALMSPDDVLLLWLRVGQGLAWAEVVAAFSARGMPADEALLRRRFEELKELLHREWRRLGLADDGDG